MLKVLTLTTCLWFCMSYSNPGWQDSTFHAQPAIASEKLVPPRLALFGNRRDKQAEEKKRTVVVRVTEARITSENISGSWFHTLRGSISNQTSGVVQNVTVHYEVRSPDDKIVDAGSVRATPDTLQNGGQGQFSTSPRAGGAVKITLVEWLGGDRSYRSFGQMQTFP